MSRPQLLLLDEPTSGLDTSEQEAAARVISDLHQATDMSMLVVEHHMDVVAWIAGKVLAIESGRVVGMGSPAELLRAEAVRDLIEADEIRAGNEGTE
jgi:branched-chain amino acid transport system ATP-binding protein